MTRQGKRPFFGIYFAIVLLLLAAYYLYESMGTTMITYAQVQDLFRSEQVESFYVKDGDSLYLSLRGGLLVRNELGSVAAFREDLGELIAEYEVEELVLGYPKNMDGSLGLRAEKAAAAARTLEESVIMPGSASPSDLHGPVKPKHSDTGIIVEGLGNCLVKFAKCCTPVPGDPVIGFITRGYGVSVHRADCPNADPDRRKPEEADRWVKVSWVDSKLPNYKTSLELSAKDRDNLTLDVAMALSTAKVKVSALSARSMPDGHATISIVAEVKDKAELEAVINKLNNIQGVYHVARASGK